MANTLAQDLRKLRRLREKCDKINEQKKEADAAFKSFQRTVYERMEAEETQSQKVAGINFVRSATTYAQVQDLDAFMKWAESQDETFIEPKPRKALLNQLVREKLDNEEGLPPGLGFYVDEYIQQRSS